MAEPLRVTVFDPETGTEQTGYVEAGNYMVIVAHPCHIARQESHDNGTTVVIIKGRKTNLMGMKEVGHG